MSDRSYRVLVGQPRVVVIDTLRVGRADTIFSLFILFMIRGHTTPVRFVYLSYPAYRGLRDVVTSVAVGPTSAVGPAAEITHEQASEQGTSPTAPRSERVASYWT